MARAQRSTVPESLPVALIAGGAIVAVLVVVCVLAADYAPSWGIFGASSAAEPRDVETRQRVLTYTFTGNALTSGDTAELDAALADGWRVKSTSQSSTTENIAPSGSPAFMLTTTVVTVTLER